MSWRSRIEHSTSLVLAALLLVLLANLGLSVHIGHQALEQPYGAPTTRLLAAHAEPDSTLHLECVSEIRTLTCPGCSLQHQIGGSHLVERHEPKTLSAAGRPTVAPRSASRTRTTPTLGPRAPPSC